MATLSPESPMAKAHQLRIEVHNLKEILQKHFYSTQKNNKSPHILKSNPLPFKVLPCLK
jgi:hypothetical protein